MAEGKFVKPAGWIKYRGVTDQATAHKDEIAQILRADSLKDLGDAVIEEANSHIVEWGWAPASRQDPSLWVNLARDALKERDNARVVYCLCELARAATECRYRLQAAEEWRREAARIWRQEMIQMELHPEETP